MAINKHVTETVKIKRRVLTEVARLAMTGELLQQIDGLPEKLVESSNKRYRCCEYKEKAIYAERIKLALGLSQKQEYVKKRLSAILPKALKYSDAGDSQVNIIGIACESCPINKFFVTNACQNCLAHPCQSYCPKDAISIVQNQAYIDQIICVECGLCKKACPYGAVLEINRPCEAACQIGAITADIDRKATINYDKCVDCGACISGCPYGAIADRSQIVSVIHYLKTEETCAILAPAFIGQLGQRENPGAILESLKTLGFSKIVEAAQGADVVVLEEAEEFLEKIPHEKSFMTSSCCPSFVSLVKKHYPQLEDNLSTTVSPMVVMAEYLKKENPRRKIIFIGPCVSKKTEAFESGVVDAVLTFEELTAILVAAGINLTQLNTNQLLGDDVSEAGRGFAQAGGVTKAMEKVINNHHPKVFLPVRAQGLKECTDLLKAFSKGKGEGNFLEGMACFGGCVGGAGTVMDGKVTKRYLQKLCEDTKLKNPKENIKAKKIREEVAGKIHTKKRVVDNE